MQLPPMPWLTIRLAEPAARRRLLRKSSQRLFPSMVVPELSVMESPIAWRSAFGW